MQETNNQIKGILAKTERLIKRYEELKEEHETVTSANDLLHKEVKDQQATIDELNNQLKIVKLAKNIGGEDPENKTELKRKINEFVKEIDKCIAMLNN